MGVPRWSLSNCVLFFILQCFGGLLVVGATTVLIGFVEFWVDIRWSDGESLPLTLVGLAAGSVIVAILESAFVLVLFVRMYRRLRHAPCEKCNQCSSCDKCRWNGHIFGTLVLLAFLLIYPGSGSSKSDDSSESTALATTILLVALSGALLCLTFVLICFASVMLTNEVFYLQTQAYRETGPLALDVPETEPLALDGTDAPGC